MTVCRHVGGFKSSANTPTNNIGQTIITDQLTTLLSQKLNAIVTQQVFRFIHRPVTTSQTMPLIAAISLLPGCYCGKRAREVVCGTTEHSASLQSEEEGCFSCQDVCGR